MTIKDYEKICLKFAEETKEWGELEEWGKHYTTQEDDWTESCDNAHGGYYVDWAFKKSDEFIKENAAQELLNQIKQRLEQAVDEEWDIEQIKVISDSIN